MFDESYEEISLIEIHVLNTHLKKKIINKNIRKNILEILDQNRISIEVTFLYFSTNQLKT